MGWNVGSVWILRGLWWTGTRWVWVLLHRFVDGLKLTVGEVGVSVSVLVGWNVRSSRVFIYPKLDRSF